MLSVEAFKHHYCAETFRVKSALWMIHCTQKLQIESQEEKRKKGVDLFVGDMRKIVQREFFIRRKVTNK